MVNSYLSDVDKDLREKRKQQIFDMYLAAYTQEEIAEAVGLSQMEVSREIEELSNNLEVLPKSLKLHAFFNDPEFETPICNVCMEATASTTEKPKDTRKELSMRAKLSEYKIRKAMITAK